MKKLVNEFFRIVLGVKYAFECILYYIQRIPCLSLFIELYGDDLIRLFYQWLT